MTTATDQAVAAALGISVRHLRELVRAGMAPLRGVLAGLRRSP